MKIKLLLSVLALGMVTSGCREGGGGNQLSEEEIATISRGRQISLSKVDVVLVATVSGSVDYSIHDVIVDEACDDLGYSLQLLQNPIDNTAPNWIQFKGGATAWFKDQAKISQEIMHMTLTYSIPEEKKISLIVVGKSLGAVLSWATFRNFDETTFSERFERIALVLIDPYGNAELNGNDHVADILFDIVKSHSLYWPKSYPDWAEQTGIFRLYYVFQQNAGGIMGADFLKENSQGNWVTDTRVCKKIDLSDNDEVDHDNIVTNGNTREIINEAFQFVWYGESWWRDEHPCIFE